MELKKRCLFRREKMKPHKLKVSFRNPLRPGIAILLLAWLAASAGGAPIGLTPLAVTPGSPAGSYTLSGFESINLYNGHLGFALPLLQIGGRGKVGYMIALSIQRQWIMRNTANDNCDSGFCPDGCTADSCGYHFIKNVEEPIQVRPYLTPGALTGRREGTSIRSQFAPHNPIYVSSLSRFTFTLPDGTQFELRDKNSNGQPFEWSGLNTPPAFQRGTEFVTADGSFATFVSNTPIEDLRPGSFNSAVSYCNSVNCEQMTPSGYLVLADGTRYDINQGRVTRMSDVDGNHIDFTYSTFQITFQGHPASFTGLTTITDPLERTVTVSYAVVTGNPYDALEFKGAGAVPRQIRIYRKPLSESLRSDNSAKTLNQLFPEVPQNNLAYSPPVISSVELPNQKSYIFRYNSYGELARVELPTGGAIEYDITGGIEGGTSSGIFGNLSGELFSTQESFIYRRLVQRRVFEGGALQSLTTYGKSDTVGGPFPSFTSPLPYIQVNTFKPTTPGCEATGTCERLSHERHFFFASAAQSYSGSTTAQDFKRSRYPTWKEGREFKTQSYDADGSTLLRQVEFTLSQPHVGWWAGLNFQPALEPPNNTRVVEVVTTLADTNQVMKQTSIDPNDPSGQTVGFDQYNNQTDVWESDYGQGAPGAILRHTHTQFVADPGYVCPPSSPFSPCQSINGAHIRRLPQAQQVYAVNADGSETLLAQNEITYDQTFLTTYSTVSGWTDPGRLERGNATKIRQWLDQTGTSPNLTDRWLEAQAAYDQCGNAVKTTDPLGR